MTTIFLIAALGIQPTETAAVESVDLIEVNHFYDEAGRLVFDQIIFYVHRPMQYEAAGGFIDTTDEYTTASVVIDGEWHQHMVPKTVRVGTSKIQHDFEVVAWRLLKHSNQLPQSDWKRGGFVATWQDGDVLRSVRSPLYRESWTQYDPELLEREYLSKHDRRGLRGEKPLPGRPLFTIETPADLPHQQPNQ